MIKDNSTITYKDNTDLQKFIEGTYIPDKIKTLEEFDNIDVKIKLVNNTEYNDLVIDGYDKTIKLQEDLIALDYNNTTEHKKLKKLVKLAVLSKFI